MNRQDFQYLAEQRLNEATALLNAGHWDGAYYLGGYAIECALKACIAKKTREHDFPDKTLVNDSYTHDLKRLVVVAGIKAALDEKAEDDPLFASNWGAILRWSESARYERNNEKNTRALIEAVANDTNGALQWLKTHW